MSILAGAGGVGGLGGNGGAGSATSNGGDGAKGGNKIIFSIKIFKFFFELGVVCTNQQYCLVMLKTFLY